MMAGTNPAATQRIMRHCGCYAHPETQKAPIWSLRKLAILKEEKWCAVQESNL